MVSIHSQRAKTLLQNPKFRTTEKNSLMRKFPGNECVLWLAMEREGKNVKNLSYTGELKDTEVLLLETVANMLTRQSLAILENLSLRECEAFLRDKNSEEALSGLGSEDESFFKRLISWLRAFPQRVAGEEFHFDSGKSSFRSLKLVDKVKEIKAFLASGEVGEIYQELPRPELVDVEELTVYVAAPYQTEAERAAFYELHLAGVAAFQEENLNFIPEG